MNRRRNPAPRALAAITLVAAGLALGITTSATATGRPADATTATSFTSRVFATGTGITHPAAKGEEPVSKPDDITLLGSHIFVGFQNGVGPQGQASTTGNLASTVVEFDLGGHAVAHWDLVGKCDGLTADPGAGLLIATVNEDANSSVYTIDAATGALVHYRYNEALPSKGGTDAISVYQGMVLISASAPGTTGKAAPQPAYPAVYRTVFDARTKVATVHPLFMDEASATLAGSNSSDSGMSEMLALTDPDSNEDVPGFATRFAGDFMLTSQGDKEQIFVQHGGEPGQSLSVLKLSASVDDTAWASVATGAIYATDNSANTIYEVTGPFRRGQVFVAVTPCDADNAPATCPAPGFPDNYLGELDPATGSVTVVPISGAALAPQGMLFRP